MAAETAFPTDDEIGEYAALELSDLGDGIGGLGELEGASPGLMGEAQLSEAACMLEMDTSVAVLVLENPWTV